MLGEIMNLLEYVFGPSFLSSVISPYLLAPFVLQLKVLILPVLELRDFTVRQPGKDENAVAVVKAEGWKCSLPCTKAPSCPGLGGLSVLILISSGLLLKKKKQGPFRVTPQHVHGTLFHICISWWVREGRTYCRCRKLSPPLGALQVCAVCALITRSAHCGNKSVEGHCSHGCERSQKLLWQWLPEGFCSFSSEQRRANCSGIAQLEPAGQPHIWG